MALRWFSKADWMSQMSKTFDVYWSFRSPYSYLATPRLQTIARDYDIDVHMRPVYPLAVRVENFFKKQNPMWVRYLILDTRRIAEMLSIPFGLPRPDPIVMNLATGEVPKEQPYIWRITRLGQAAEEAGKGLAFASEVSRIIWGGDVVNWHEGDHLAQAASRAGLDLAKLEAKVATDSERLHQMIETNQNALNAAGHWGVPTMVFEGEPFFGQDRIDVLMWRMTQRGLQRRH
jgi:2-hydroxychromene-2-carboxylate isomerase